MRSATGLWKFSTTNYPVMESPGNAICNSTPPPNPPTADCGTQSGMHRSKSNLYGPCSKSSLSSSHCKQVRGPSTPLGCRLAALKKTELEKVHSDDGHNVPCIFESAILRLRSHAQHDQQNTPARALAICGGERPHTRVLSQMWGCTDYSPQADGSSAQDATWFSRC